MLMEVEKGRDLGGLHACGQHDYMRARQGMRMAEAICDPRKKCRVCEARIRRHAGLSSEADPKALYRHQHQDWAFTLTRIVRDRDPWDIVRTVLDRVITYAKMADLWPVEIAEPESLTRDLPATPTEVAHG